MMIVLLNIISSYQTYVNVLLSMMGWSHKRKKNNQKIKSKNSFSQKVPIHAKYIYIYFHIHRCVFLWMFRVLVSQPNRQ